MRPRKIDNVDVVANARTVGRLIIGAENFYVRLLTERDFEHVGNQMCLKPVIFPKFAGRSGGVEITQRYEF